MGLKKKDRTPGSHFMLIDNRLYHNKLTNPIIKNFRKFLCILNYERSRPSLDLLKSSNGVF